MNQNLQLIQKVGGVTALLVSSLVISNPCYALNTTLSVTTFEQNRFISGDLGQSFINDPMGTGESIKIDTWTFTFANEFSQSLVDIKNLNIYSGIGSGGTIVGTSNATSKGFFGSFLSVTWTFGGDFAITDTSTYTAAIVLDSVAPALFVPTTIISDPNTFLTSGGIGLPGLSTIFRGTFSAVPVPFEFSPALGLFGLGALWAFKKFLLKK
jgi:hypothetical protein